MAKKWQVSLGEKVLGHYAGRTPEEAVEKAKNNSILNFSGNEIFFVHKAGINDSTVYEVK